MQQLEVRKHPVKDGEGKLRLESRTKKSLANITTSLANNILNLVLKFVVRTVFIYTLGVTYLGINGLFTSIISLLSLADLGFSIALPFSLYKPIAEKDQGKIQVLMKFYSKVYNVVGVTVILIGIALVPFLPQIIKDMPNISNIWLIYLLFVANSAISYFFVYKRTLIVADQKGYIVNAIESVFSIVVSLIQIVILVIYKNFIAYLCSAVLVTLIKNLYISYKCNQLYPYIKQKTNLKPSKEQLKTLSKDIFALTLYKVAIAVETGIDNIVISRFLGVITVGLVSNYVLIIHSLQAILMLAFNSLTASIGNLVSKEDGEKVNTVFKAIDLFCILVFGVCAITLWILVNPFIMLWAGEGYLLESSVVLVLAINFYFFGTQSTTSSFRNAYGLFWQGRFRPILMCLFNIVFSVLFVQWIGLVGVYIATVLSRLTTVNILDAYIVHKHGLKRPVVPYYFKQIRYTIVVTAIAVLTQWATSFLPIVDWVSLIGKGLATLFISSAMFLIIFWRRKEFQYIFGMLKSVFCNLTQE